MLRWALGLILVGTFPVQGQWAMQTSPVKADFRGIHSVDGKVAWASGTKGTVLRTVDGGATWQACAVPPGAEALDFRAVQAFDAQRALVMSAGTGTLSRIYKTVDGCRTWRLILTNPDAKGFWDEMRFDGPGRGVLVGDQVEGQIPVFVSKDAGETWTRSGVKAEGDKQSLFAASNSSLLVQRGSFYFATGGGVTALVRVSWPDLKAETVGKPDLASGEAAGIFSIAARTRGKSLVIVAVGGDYKAPDQAAGTAATWSGAWKTPTELPHGYRSAVEYDAAAKVWIAVGPSGTDVSDDDGGHWRGVKSEDGSDAKWNALSLPFAVGPQGRIGKLRPEALAKR